MIEQFYLSLKGTASSDQSDLGVMAMQGYSTFPKAPDTVKCHTQDTRYGISYPSVEGQSILWDRNEWALVPMTWRFVFMYLSYLSTKTHCINY